MVATRFPRREADLRPFRLGLLVDQVVARIQGLSSHRHVLLHVAINSDCRALTDKAVAEKALMSLIKNAVENTPDGGSVTVSLGASGNGAELMVRDTGVGITEASQKQIFGGFYHARETDYYSTKRPFDFDAGGKGLELLKLKLFAEAYGFEVTCQSRRCAYLPGEDDTCPGDVSTCPHVQDAAGCAAAGGTAFILVFPMTHRL